MVTQFVGFIGAFRDAGALSQLLAGTLGGLLTTRVTFAPCSSLARQGSSGCARTRHCFARWRR
jgi:hypothetical protein